MPKKLEEYLAGKRDFVLKDVSSWTPGTDWRGPSSKVGSASYVQRLIDDKTGVRGVDILWERAKSDYAEKQTAAGTVESYTVRVPYIDAASLLDFEGAVPHSLPPGVTKGYEEFRFRVEGTDLTPEAARAQFEKDKEYVERLIDEVNAKISLWKQVLEAEAIPVLDERKAYLDKKNAKLSAFGIPNKSS
jgi:hypothetical protein